MRQVPSVLNCQSREAKTVHLLYWQEREELLKNVEELEDNVEELKTQMENTKNEWLAAKGEQKALDQQLVKERGKIRKLANEKHGLLEKVNVFYYISCRFIP